MPVISVSAFNISIATEMSYWSLIKEHNTLKLEAILSSVFWGSV